MKKTLFQKSRGTQIQTHSIIPTRSMAQAGSSCLTNLKQIMCEGWNNHFRTLIGHDQSTIWKVIEILQAECACITRVLIQEEHGIRAKKG